AVCTPSQADVPIDALPLLTEAERHQLLVQWNHPQADYDTHTCLHQLVAAQAGRTPEAVAVVFANRHLSYRELDQRANQLAHYLRGQGVGPGTQVALCL